MSGSHLLSVHDELTVCTSASTNGACSGSSRGGGFTTEAFTVPPSAAVPELDLARIRAYCDQKVPARYRAEARVEMTVRGASVSIFDCRPPWHPSLTEWSRVPIAQLRYDRSTGQWTLYWADRNSRWHLYDDIEPGTVVELLDEVERDPIAIFWG